MVIKYYVRPTNTKRWIIGDDDVEELSIDLEQNNKVVGSVDISVEENNVIQIVLKDSVTLSIVKTSVV
jgi:hypothetical protein